MNDMFIRIVTEAQEAEDEFIFTTIQPFCEDVIKRKISKAELAKLLSQPQIVRCGECKYRYNHDICCPSWYPEDYDFCSHGERRTDEI